MRINITHRTGKITRLHLPQALVLNGISAALLSSSMRKKDVDISAKHLRTLFRAIKQYKRSHPDWKLMEVQSSNGEAIEIVL